MPSYANPSSDVCPNFIAPEFLQLRQSITHGRQVSDAELVVELETSWRLLQDLKQAAWDTEANLEADAEAAKTAADAIALAAAELALTQEKVEADKKKPQFSVMTVGRVVPTDLLPRPSQYAVNKLEQKEFVEIYYFTLEGCTEAAATLRSAPDDTFSLARSDDTLALRPSSGYRASKNMIQDHSLNWRQFTTGTSLYLECARAAGWPALFCRTLENFWYSLERHPKRIIDFGEEALLLYQDRVRHAWHVSLKRDEAFDVSIINEALLGNILDELRGNAHAAAIRQVSLSPLPSSPRQMNPRLCSFTLPPSNRHALNDTTKSCNHNNGGLNTLLAFIPCSIPP